LVGEGHHGRGAGVHGALPGGVDVVAVDAEYGCRATQGLRALGTLLGHLVGDHDDRVADLELCVHDLPVWTREPHDLLGGERLLIEIDGPDRAGHDQVRSDGMVPFGDRWCFLRHDWLLPSEGTRNIRMWPRPGNLGASRM